VAKSLRRQTTPEACGTVFEGAGALHHRRRNVCSRRGTVRRAPIEEGAANDSAAPVLQSCDTIVNIDGVLFVHGGISPAVAELGCAGINRRIRRELTAGFAELGQQPLASLAARPDGPLWFRGLAQEDEDTFAHGVDTILASMRSHTIVIGHTVPASGRVTLRFDGRVIQIDTGMLASHYPHGRASALELRDGKLTAIYEDAREAVSVAVDGRDHH
jgi:hypothetical protein